MSNYTRAIQTEVLDPYPHLNSAQHIFYTFLPAVCVSIPSPKYQSKMTNPLFFQTAFVTSSRESKNAVHAYKNDTQVYYCSWTWRDGEKNWNKCVS